MIKPSCEDFFSVLLKEWGTRNINLAFYRALELSTISLELMEKYTIILDVGCGDGAVTKALTTVSRCNCYVVGMDVDARSIRKALQHGRINDGVIADVRALPLRKRSLDLIICISVLEHIANLQKALNEIADTLKLRGRFIGTFPTNHFLEMYIIPRFLSILPIFGKPLVSRYVLYEGQIQRIVNWLDWHEWIRAFHECGLSVVNGRIYMGPLDVLFLDFLGKLPPQLKAIPVLKSLTILVLKHCRTLSRRNIGINITVTAQTKCLPCIS